MGGAVYAARNPAWPGWWKVGAAQSPRRRLRSYQTSSPFRDYEIVWCFYHQSYRDAERFAHRHLGTVAEERSGEWFRVSEAQITHLFEEVLAEWQNSHS